MKTKNFLLISVSSFISKIFAVIREAIFSFYFGASKIIDSYSISSTIIDRFFLGVISESINNSLIPFLAEEKEKGNDVKHIVKSIKISTFLILIMLCLFIISFSEALIVIFAPGLLKKPDVFNLTLHYLKFGLMGFSIFLLLSIDSFSEQFNENFIPTFILNSLHTPLMILTILSYIFINKTADENVIPYVFVVPAIVFAFIFFLLKMHDKKAAHLSVPKLAELSKSFKIFLQFVRYSLPIIIGRISVFLYAYGDQLIASFLAVGSISIIRYATLIFNSLDSIFAYPLRTIFYPPLAKISASNENDNFNRESLKLIFISLFLAVTATIASIILSKPVIKIIYFRGQMDINSFLSVVSVFRIYMIGFSLATLSQVFRVILLASKSAPFYSTVNIIFSILNIVLNYVFAIVFSFGVNGIAMATVLTWLLSNVVMITYFFRKQNLSLIDVSNSLKDTNAYIMSKIKSIIKM